MKGLVTFGRSIRMTPQTVGAEAPVCFAPPRYSSLMAHMYWFVLHCIPQPICDDAIETSSPKYFMGGSCGFLPLPWSRVVGEPFSLNCPCWFMCGDCKEDWATAADSCVVFATGLNCWYPDNEDWIGPQRNYF